MFVNSYSANVSENTTLSFTTLCALKRESGVTHRGEIRNICPSFFLSFLCVSTKQNTNRVRRTPALLIDPVFSLNRISYFLQAPSYPYRCPTASFQCESGKCIPSQQVCDGRLYDCPGGEVRSGFSLRYYESIYIRLYIEWS